MGCPGLFKIVFLRSKHPMATPVKPIKKAPQAPPAAVKAAVPKAPALTEERKRQIRLTFGLLLLLSGAFVCVSVVSYYFSWNNDQDKLLSGKGIFEFMFRDNSPVANLGGRAGAAISHLLVFKGAGIASLTVGIGLLGLGLNILYGRKATPLLLYMRWISILLLIVAPTLSYLFPHGTYSYPLGGAFGDVTIDYLNGLLGKTGTGMVLFCCFLFFLLVVIALDLRPWLLRMRLRAQKFAEAFSAAPQFNEQPTATTGKMPTANADGPAPIEDEEEEDDDEPEIKPVHPVEANRLREQMENIPLVIEDTRFGKEWDMAVIEKPAAMPPVPPTKASGNFTILPDNEIPGQFLADEEAYGGTSARAQAIEDEFDNEPPFDDYDDEEDPKEEKKTEPEFVVTTKEEKISPALKHGAHISIADNQPFAPEETLRNYKFPTLDLLVERNQETISLNKEELERNKEQIIKTLSNFGIEIKSIKATVGPTVTLYEIVPAEGVRISKIKNLEDDIALNLAALGIRIIAPIPGRGTIGIEVPNANKQIVSMRALLSSEKFVNNSMTLPIALGKKIDNENYIVDLATMPHLLVAGATGQGKSVGINAILVSLLYKKHPSTLKFVMVDPKKVELFIYRTIEKHFLAKLPNEDESIITDIKKVIYTLKALCDEMDGRYDLLKDAGARNIKEYNEKFIARRLNPLEHQFLPFIVLVIDEFADLIMTAGKEVEMPIARLAQLARAVGIHLIIATQRPSVNVITGTIKANFPARIAFKVSSKIDSRTILDTGGAEQLIGRGDMLISHGSELLRLQCAFVDTPEVEKIVEFIGDQQGYPEAHPLPEPEMDDDDVAAKSFDKKNRDKLFEDCARVVIQTQSGSTSMLQRRFNLGYNRAGRIMDQLEAAGVVGPASGSKPRDVYFHTESDLEEFLGTLE